MKGAAPLADGADDATLAALDGADPLAGLDRARLVVVNGAWRPELSDLAGLDGVTVTALADVLAKAPERVGRLFADSDDTALALNSAFMQGGVVVDIAKDAKPARPIEIVHLTAAGEPVAVFIRDMVTVGANASVRIVDSHRGPDGIAYQVNAVTELSLARRRPCRMGAAAGGRRAPRSISARCRRSFPPTSLSTISSSMPAARCGAGRASPPSPGAA